VDGIAVRETGVDPMDEKNHLAKLRVAGSNPVVRSKESPGQSATSSDHRSPVPLHLHLKDATGQSVGIVDHQDDANADIEKRSQGAHGLNVQCVPSNCGWTRLQSCDIAYLSWERFL
jgi:hypothetical protein